MLKKLVARHRVLKLGATLVGASALAIGFASPAFAFNPSVPTGGNANSANQLIVMGGSNTTYFMMTQLSNLFNEAPGCDLAAASGTTQPLDYGCPGLNGEPGTSLSHDVDTNITGNVTSGSKTITGVSSTSGLLAFQAISGNGIPAGDTIAKIKGSKITLATAATGTFNNDALSVITTEAVGENGLVPFANENPFNDVLVQEPALGSSNGIAELEEGGPGHIPASPNVSAINAARSSRAPNLATASKPDDNGLNFVAYAMDGVSWLHWTKVGGASTPSASVTNIPLGTLEEIWTGSLSCTVSGVNYTQNWICLGGSNAPIALYIAQNGSGTESTWVSALGIPSTDTFPFGGEDANHVIFENETASILANGDEKDAIFFFSYGKYQAECASNPSFCSGSSTSTTALGEVNGIPVNKSTIAAQLPGATGTEFPIDRLLYNVYSDGSNTNITGASAATLNAVSEDGFLCKPSTASDVDPNTGTTYLKEIDAVISAQGFYPLPLLVENGEGDTSNPLYNTTASGITNPAWGDGLSASAYNAANEGPSSTWNFPSKDQDTDNSAIQGTYTGVYDDGNTNATVPASAANPVGYCLVLTTDANGHP